MSEKKISSSSRVLTYAVLLRLVSNEFDHLSLCKGHSSSYRLPVNETAGTVVLTGSLIMDLVMPLFFLTQ